MYVCVQNESVNSLLATSMCDSSWLNSFTPANNTADLAADLARKISIGEFMAQQSEALGSLDGNDVFARVSTD